MDSYDLFEPAGNLSKTGETHKHAPLAARMRPRTLDEVAGQEHLLAEGKLLRRTLKADRLMSAVFCGPPGSGKTTLACLISHASEASFVSVNAVTSNVSELRKIIETARRSAKRTVLFIDEIHRFNKAQQDVLMPDVESGVLILIGATTHNPAFSINGPLLSRSLVFELKPLENRDLIRIIKRALEDKERGFGTLKIRMEEGAMEHLAENAAGDARRALNALETGVLTTPPDGQGVIHFTKGVAEESCQKKIVYYDHDEDYHYDTISAFIKSMRGSDPDASVYWLAKMLYAGEDPRFIVRRILILASEDIGNADPQALILAQAGMQAVEFVGMPEAQIILSQLVVYMAMAPKSNASYLAIGKAMQDVKEKKAQEVPPHLRDTHYQSAERMGRGQGYRYPHDYPGHYVVQEYMPEKTIYYQPTQNGFEKAFYERLQKIRASKEIAKNKDGS